MFLLAVIPDAELDPAHHWSLFADRRNRPILYECNCRNCKMTVKHVLEKWSTYFVQRQLFWPTPVLFVGKLYEYLNSLKQTAAFYKYIQTSEDVNRRRAIMAIHRPRYICTMNIILSFSLSTSTLLILSLSHVFQPSLVHSHNIFWEWWVLRMII